MDDDNELKEFENLPEGWKWVRLGEVVEKIRNGYVYSFQQIKKEGIPITRIESISEGCIDENKVGYLDLTHNELVKDFKLEVGDILFSHINSFEHVGKTSIYKGKPSFLIHGMNLLLLRAKKSICSPFFLIFLLKSEEIRGKIRNLSGQAVNQVSVNTFDLYNLKLPLPPLPEQQKIAEILETIDNAIEKTEKIIEKFQRIKQGLMQDLLTKGIDEKGNIRSEKTHKFKDSPLGRIPEEWEVVRLGEVGELRKEKALSPKNNIYIGLENIEKGTGKINGFIPSDEIKGISNIFKTGDILFGKLRPNLRKFWYAKYNGYCSTEFLVIFPINEKIIKEFLYLVIGSNNFLNLAESKVFGTKMPRTSWDILKNYSFPLPPLPEQQRIAEILSQIDETIEKEQKYKEKLERLKQGLMEDLLTGKVQVNHLIKEGVENVLPA